jgi:glycosyltransferase involved in cell wall biosynthesis
MHDGKAKVLEISSYPPPHAGWGVRVSFVRKWLEANGHRCQVLNIGKNRKVKSAEYLDIQTGADYLRKVFRHAREGYLIHTHLNGDSIKGLILVLLAELISVVVGHGCVLTFHAGPVQRFFPRFRSPLMTPFYSLAFVLAKRIICNNAPVKENITTYGVAAKSVVTIPAFSRQYLAYREVRLPEALESFFTAHTPILAAYFFLRPEFFVESLIEALRRLSLAMPRMGAVLIGADTTTQSVTAMITAAGLQANVFQAGDLTHDEFMTLISKVRVYVRTPKKDGVCSSVLEALALGIPVVGSENGTRPAGVITFETGNALDLTEKLLAVCKHYERTQANVVRPSIEDTVEDEARLLLEFA